MLRVEDLSFRYLKKQILSDISFEALEGEIICLLGPNGSGKTTLFKCILQLLTYEKGKIYFEKENLAYLNRKDLAKRVAYIPQTLNISFNFTVQEMVLMGRSMHLSNFGVPTQNDKKIVHEALEKLHIEHLEFKEYLYLSGGEKQMVLIARALVQESHILIMDEPTSALDYGNQVRTFKQIQLLAKEGKIIIMSSHNPDHAFFYGDKVLLLKYGKLIGYGIPHEVINEQIMSDLYGVNLKIFSTFDNSSKVCVPNKLEIEEEKI